MKIDLTRRDVLKFGAGAAAGALMTPAPWKAVDDLAIWTQNWKWIPVPPKGPESFRSTICSLCPAGCAVSARCIGGQPVSMHPVGAGALCTLGLTGHHLRFHPARIGSVARVMHTTGGVRRVPVGFAAVVDAAKRTIAQGGRIAVLDTRPGRSNSVAWRAFLASTPDGTYIPAPGREGSSLTTLATMLGRSADTTSIDLAKARTILSFGAPLAEGWGDPRLMQRLVSRDRAMRVIQIEPVRSATASLAGRWLPAKPGSEAALALGIAHVLIAEGLVDPGVRRISDFDAYAAVAAKFTPDAVSRATHVPAAEMIAAARKLAHDGPAAIIAADGGGGRFDRTTETAILGLNLLLPDVSVLRREPLPSPFDDIPLATETELDAIDDRSIALLIVDASEGDVFIPWRAIEKKLVKDEAAVIALAPFFAGTVRHATFVVPTPAFLESIHELPTPFDAAEATLAISSPMVQHTVQPHTKSHDPMELLAALSGSATTSEELLRKRVAKIHGSGIGSVATGDSSKSISKLASADDLWSALVDGGRWLGAPVERTIDATEHPSLLGPAREALMSLAVHDQSLTDSRRPLVLLAYGAREATASAVVSPVMTKLYSESRLRNDASIAVVNPATARQLGIDSGTRIRLETSGGALLTRLATDDRVMPGVVVANAAPTREALGVKGATSEPALLDILPPGRSWRATAASVMEA